jgi:two-component sensor histidine kinase
MELQIMNADDNTTVNTLRDSQLRIQSIAMIHEKLYQSEALLGIGFDVYLKELINAISNAYESEELETEITYDLAAVDINVDQAIPCSLIVNEVIVNCYKHAFNDVEEGCIEVVSQYDDPEFSIHITDNGVGLSADFDIDKQQSLGMTLIQTLAEQLQGEISISSNGNDRGTHFALYFEKEKEE